MSLPAEVRDEAPENLEEKKESADAAASATGEPKSDVRICLLCGHALRTRFARVLDAKTLETFSILECPACGLGSTEPNPKDLSKYYRDYHGGRHGITNSFCTNRRIRLLENVAGNQSGKRLLDIGCGEGTFLLAAKAKGWSIAGTEMNPSSALSAGLVVYSQLSEVRALAPFDCITLWHSLEHMPDPRATLQEARSLLSPDGIVIIAVPDAGGLRRTYSGRSGCISMSRVTSIISRGDRSKIYCSGRVLRPSVGGIRNLSMICWDGRKVRSISGLALRTCFLTC